ncbi:MAG: hypothetical protein MHM6MM_003245 [Cercozoa sp. M6MM]
MEAEVAEVAEVAELANRIIRSPRTATEEDAETILRYTSTNATLALLEIVAAERHNHFVWDTKRRLIEHVTHSVHAVAKRCFATLGAVSAPEKHLLQFFLLKAAHVLENETFIQNTVDCVEAKCAEALAMLVVLDDADTPTQAALRNKLAVMFPSKNTGADLPVEALAGVEAAGRASVSASPSQKGKIEQELLKRLPEPPFPVRRGPIVAADGSSNSTSHVKEAMHVGLRRLASTATLASLLRLCDVFEGETRSQLIGALKAVLTARAACFIDADSNLQHSILLAVCEFHARPTASKDDLRKICRLIDQLTADGTVAWSAALRRVYGRVKKRLQPPAPIEIEASAGKSAEEKGNSGWTWDRSTVFLVFVIVALVVSIVWFLSSTKTKPIDHEYHMTNG